MREEFSSTRDETRETVLALQALEVAVGALDHELYAGSNLSIKICE